MSAEVNITIRANAELVQALRNGLASREELHSEIAVAVRESFVNYLSRLERHKTAQQLGATPTKHLAKSALRIEADADGAAAYLRIPRSTGLGRAFRDLTITPGSGKKYLTIPAHRTTYGKRAGEITAELRFAMVGGRHRALVFASGPDVGSVAYWLRTSVTIQQDRTLLPSDGITRATARAATVRYLEMLRGGAEV